MRKRREESASKRPSLTVASIHIDVLNLGEQLGVYFAQKAAQLDESKERQFFLILLSISALNLLKSLFPNERIKIGISFLIEIGELFCYLFALERTLAVMAIALTFFGLQCVCYIITLYLTKSVEQAPTTEHRLREFLNRRLIYVGINGGPLLTLFLSSESRFRQTPYEVSLIISVFLTSVMFDSSLEFGLVMSTWANRMRVQNQLGQPSRVPPDFRQFMKNSNAVQRAWAGGTYLVSIAFSCFFMATLTVVLASLELKEKGSQLPAYDRGICIYFLVATAFVLLFSPCFGFCLCFVIYSIVCNKHVSS